MTIVLRWRFITIAICKKFRSSIVWFWIFDGLKLHCNFSGLKLKLQCSRVNLFFVTNFKYLKNLLRVNFKNDIKFVIKFKSPLYFFKITCRLMNLIVNAEICNSPKTNGKSTKNDFEIYGMCFSFWAIKY